MVLVVSQNGQLILPIKKVKQLEYIGPFAVSSCSVWELLARLSLKCV